jgi:hypothetical protein
MKEYDQNYHKNCRKDVEVKQFRKEEKLMMNN